ncbi:hypothetical protein [Dictyobacter formicarum]|uniref:Zorya protein ZorC EH domain-containing protein n=1 Tax=Dictyobacter formicarum TaxID=2778368 RepID=A0ABQ3VI51_9CHLR|nr:hypothetical protein [Dictyobacter formicarum]GHO85865.1 hypothetical protein KSZ_38710 [Dictyobacter formicarum]
MSKTNMSNMDKLFQSLHQRRRPEDVAQLILEQLTGRLNGQQKAILQNAAQGSLKQRFLTYTSMLEDFAKPVGLARQVAVAGNLFNIPPLAADQCDNPTLVENYIHQVNQQIKKDFGRNDFKAHRLNHEAREAAGMDISRRRYNKLFRILTRMEAKLQTLINEWKKLELTKIGKSGFSSRITWEMFSADKNSACFIAYYVARCNLRSEFTIAGQQRPYDEIADMLFSRCQNSSTTNWWAIAHVYPDQNVLLHLSDEQKGNLLGKWFSVLQEIAGLLKETWEKSKIKRETMVVRPGNDSSTWNTMASAWNRARDHWVALIYALGMEEILDKVWPGKVLRLMAADVVAWHYRSGGKLDPNTDVWKELPLSWEVLAGTSTCTRQMVEEVCHKHGLDPEKSGWTTPRPRKIVAKFRPTPELVHGVTIENPYLATFLRKAGVFSGKHIKNPHFH